MIPGRDERGAAAVLVVALTGLVLLLGLSAAFVTATAAAHRRAQGAADLAALAGAGALARGRDPCAASGVIAVDNGARVRSCTVLGADVLVEVVVSGPRWWGHGWEPRGRARAGPATTGW